MPLRLALLDNIIDYPDFFETLLRGAPKLRGPLDSSVALVASVLQLSHRPFFVDYTDHGPEHLAKVCNIADKLLADSARQVFSAEDVAVFVLSVLLHELGMHLSESGFASLVNSPSSVGQHSLDKTRWPDLWHEFLDTARHWDDRRLIQVFGADETGAPRALVKDPFEHYDNLTESDRKLIGEFIRENHVRMAHEFAVFGFPGANGARIKFDAFGAEMMDLAGVIARSHGMALRSTLGYLEQQFSQLEYNRVHPLFLMALLRIADYLDLGEDRAPLIAFRYKEFKSLVSHGEFRVNQAFRTISWGNPDPESIHIPTKPSGIYEFLALKDWLTAIQSELDRTWAVLGEVYGKHPRFSKLGLSIRRVRSNVDDVAGFAQTSRFVPKQIELSVNTRVLKLFLQPLYGNRSEVGIGELVQNAVDAVRERWQFVKNHPSLNDVPLPEQDGDVVVTLEGPDGSGAGTLTVSDKGIGMTEEVVSDYFLKAGASLRESIAWKREFELPAAEDSAQKASLPRSQVLRSGRFGIGILTAFLLGDELEVFTRHIAAQRGLHFRVRFDSRSREPILGPIQLDYEAAMPAGTTIRVKVRPSGKESNSESDIFSAPSLWDWYCFSKPTVVRTAGKQQLSQDRTAPSAKEELSEDWHAVPTSEYAGVYMKVPGADSVWPALICNGIKVRSTERIFNPLFGASWETRIFPSDIFFWFRPPALSILDPDGRLPLNLQRTGLTTTELSFSDRAFEIRARTFLAKLLEIAPERREITEELVDWLFRVVEFEHLFPVFFTSSGTALLTIENLNLAQITTCLTVEIKHQSVFQGILDRYDATTFVRSTRSSSIYGIRDMDHWARGVRVAVHAGTDAGAISSRKLKKEFENSAMAVYATGGCPNTPLGQSLINALSENGIPDSTGQDLILSELFFDRERLSTGKPRRSIYTEFRFRDGVPKSPMAGYWQKIIRGPVIPFSITARRAELRHAFDALREFSPNQGRPRGTP
jgi:molecular chaperone HtpG